jgi:hypothetical protein
MKRLIVIIQRALEGNNLDTLNQVVYLARSLGMTYLDIKGIFQQADPRIDLRAFEELMQRLDKVDNT